MRLLPAAGDLLTFRRIGDTLALSDIAQAINGRAPATWPACESLMGEMVIETWSDVPFYSAHCLGVFGGDSAFLSGQDLLFSSSGQPGTGWFYGTNNFYCGVAEHALSGGVVSEL